MTPYSHNKDIGALGNTIVFFARPGQLERMPGFKISRVQERTQT